MHKTIAFILALLISQAAYAVEPPESVMQSTREMAGMGIDAGQLERLNTRMQEQNYTNANILRIHEQIRAAVAAGLPGGPVIEKANEGLAKRVGPQATERALQQVRKRYEYAYGWTRSLAVREDTLAETGDTVAEAMAAGLQQRDLERIRERLHTKMHAMEDSGLCLETARTLRTMTRARVSSQTAADAVDEALKNGYTAQEMRQLREAFQRQSRSGNATSIAKGYTESIRGGGSAASLGHGGGQGGSGSAGSEGSGANGGGSGRSGGNGHGGGNR